MKIITSFRFILVILGLIIIISATAITLTIILFEGEKIRHTVKTTNPKVGIHTRLTDEVEKWKIEKTFEMVREMGALWAVEYFPWAYMEPSRGRIDWEHADIVVEAAYHQGINLIARIDWTPEWARPKDTPGRYIDKENYDAYIKFLKEFVKRYYPKVEYFIIWNEPNLAFEWGFRKPNPQEYTELLKRSYLGIKEIAPDAKVIMAGLAPIAENSEMAMDDLIYLRGVYEAGGKNYFDILSAHAYGWKFPPDDPAEPSRINFARVELLRKIMVENGDENKPIFITEGGWNDHPRWTKAVKPAQRIDYTLRAYQKATEEWPWCKVVAFWAFRLPQPSRTYNDYYTFVNFDFTPKPIYEAIKKYATGN